MLDFISIKIELIMNQVFFPQMIDVLSPSNTLTRIAYDANLTLSHLYDLISHFVYRGLLLVVYPFCNKNEYATTSKVFKQYLL